mgnify:CR=1 FL=1
MVSKKIDPNASKNLSEIRDKRGYLLPHHGLLSLTDPDLLLGYDQCYSALTLKKRYLEEKEKEFIWLGILAVTEEYIATQHLNKFLDAGGTSLEIECIIQLATYARGVSSIIFADKNWKKIDNKIDGKNLYFSGIKTLNKNNVVEESLMNLALVAIHTSIKQHTPLSWHIKKLYDFNTKEAHIAEAITYSMFTGSIPNFIEGCSVWRDMIIKKEIIASKEFLDWAMLDQDGPNQD